MCNFLCSVSSQQKFQATGQCYIWPGLQLSDGPALQLLDSPVSQLRVTAQFYLENKGKYILEAWGYADPKDVKRRESESERERERGRGKERERESVKEREGGRDRERDSWTFGSSFYMFFSSPPGPALWNWTSQECCLFYLGSSLWPLDLILFCFPGLFPSLSFSHHPFGLLFPILTT